MPENKIPPFSTFGEQFLLGLSFLFFLLLATAGCDSNKVQLSNLKTEVEEQNKSLHTLRVEVSQQNSILHRALGNHIPIDLPAETKQQLQSLKEKVNDEKNWPKSEKEAESLNKMLENLVVKLPPWAEEEVLPQLNVLRWGIRVLLLLRQNPKPSDEKAEDLLEEYQALLQAAPNGSPETLQRTTQQQVKQLEEQANRYQVKSAITRGRAALQSGEDLAAAAAALEKYESDPEAKSLGAQCRQNFLEKETQKKIDLLRSTLRASRGLSSMQLQQAGILRVQDAAFSLLLDLRTEGIPRKKWIEETEKLIEECNQGNKELAKAQQAEAAKKLRDYQRWALENIQKFDAPNGWHYDVTLSWIRDELKKFKNPSGDVDSWPLFSTFPSTKDLLHEKLGVDLSQIKGAALTTDQQRLIYEVTSTLTGWKGNIDEELAYRATRDGMVLFLLPINVALLDPSVAQLYNKAFQKGWSKLEGREDQLHVAQQSAIVIKKGLD
jgi:nitroreductase